MKKSKKGFTKYVIQNDPEKYYAANVLSDIYIHLLPFVTLLLDGLITLMIPLVRAM